MAAWKLLALVLLLLMVDLGIRADPEAEVSSEVSGVLVDPTPSPLEQEVSQMKAKISALESRMLKQAKDLKYKEDNILRLEETIDEKTARIASLQGKIESLQKKGAIDAQELADEAHLRARELDKEVEILNRQIEAATRKRDLLLAQASVAEQMAQELNAKIDTIQKTNGDLKLKVQRVEYALQLTKEELMKTQLQATTNLKELTEVHGAWLPPWLASQFVHYQDFVSIHWEKYGRPSVDVFLQKASEKVAQAQILTEPYFEAAQRKWIPLLKDELASFTIYLEKHVRYLSRKSIEIYVILRNFIIQNLVKVQQVTDPHLQEARKFSRPYIDQIAVITRPHVDKVRVFLKPYKEHAVLVSDNFVKSTATYHQKIQAVIRNKLKNNETIETLATKEFVWFTASGFLALPIFFMYKVLLGIFRTNGRKSFRSAQSKQTNRRQIQVRR